ncbi:hypothetical protein FALCPG4_016978 [Fusarium falciforme]
MFDDTDAVDELVLKRRDQQDQLCKGGSLLLLRVSGRIIVLGGHNLGVLQAVSGELVWSEEGRTHNGDALTGLFWLGTPDAESRSNHEAD